MENLKLIEKEAQEHHKIAQHEKEVAQKLKVSALTEIKKSKARETLMKIEYKLADIKLSSIRRYLTRIEELIDMDEKKLLKSIRELL